jgi:hypothetical protein
MLEHRHSNSQHIKDIIEDFTMFNVYNEKNQKSSSNEYTIERKLRTIDLTKNNIICDDFNAHHQWWNSRITSSIRANALIDWWNKFSCELINISDEYTFTRENSSSVIDLTFATIDLASKITNWLINVDARIDSNHEVIEFAINVENIETVDNSMTKKFNTQKANWNKFNEYFKNNHSNIKSRMSRLLNNPCSKNLNEGAKLLRDVIIEASNQSISKRRSCENSKVWWTDELTQLRKNLAKAKRMYKALQIEENLTIFKRTSFFSSWEDRFIWLFSIHCHSLSRQSFQAFISERQNDLDKRRVINEKEYEALIEKKKTQKTHIMKLLIKKKISRKSLVA